MPLKTQKHQNYKKHPKSYAKVYWPYLPLLVIVGLGLFFGQSSVARSQRGVLAYATNVSSESLLEATNQQRVSNSRNTLKINNKLSEAAQAKAEDMAKRNYWSHNTPDGQEPWVFFSRAGYSYQKAGENLAFGFANSKETVAGWMNSPSHKANLLDSSYKEVGFGIANSPNYQGSGPETIIVAEYGQPFGEAAPVAQNDQSIPLNNNHQLAVTSTNPIRIEPKTQTITKIEALTGGSTPWITFVLGLLCGSCVVYLLLKHGIRLRRMFIKGEKFVMKHTVFDLTVVSFIALVAILLQGVGTIR